MQEHECGQSRNQIIHDATRAAVVYLVQELHKLPRDEAEASEFFWNVIYTAVEYAVFVDRGVRLTPSKN
jgi:hypothetical protein